MKQYGTALTNYTSCRMDIQSPAKKRGEAILGSSYDGTARYVRRRIGRSAEAWWRAQTESVRTAGMPWLYHCGGVK